MFVVVIVVVNDGSNVTSCWMLDLSLGSSRSRISLTEDEIPIQKNNRCLQSGETLIITGVNTWGIYRNGTNFEINYRKRTNFKIN